MSSLNAKSKVSRLISTSTNPQPLSSSSSPAPRSTPRRSIMLSMHPSSHTRAAAPVTGDYDTTHSTAVRKYLRTYGLVPPNVESYQTQAARCLKQLALKTAPIDKYLYLSNLRNTDVHLFYRLVVDYMKELTPLIYTPVVGEACLKWSEIYERPEGLYLSYSDRGNLSSILHNWPEHNVEITVVTDGSRILGLGDLGINGMGIPVGKLALYTGCAGIRPECTLPLTLDLGTNNKSLREDPLYMGSRREKITPEEEQAFLDELMVALTDKWPGLVKLYKPTNNLYQVIKLGVKDLVAFWMTVRRPGRLHTSQRPVHTSSLYFLSTFYTILSAC